MKEKVEEAFEALEAYCRAEDYRGWDPYDGLNSRVFKALPLVGRSAVARLVWIQLFKRNPLNLRGVLGVPKQHNAKGIALFLQGYCHLWHARRAVGADTAAVEERITYLANLLLSLRAPGVHGAAWGYNFPWQCRREFLFPAYEPTVVATAFGARALWDAADILKRDDWRQAAVSAAEFVAHDLRVTDGIISYSRMPGNDTIYNASLLGSEILARAYSVTGNARYRAMADASVQACCQRQEADGSWTYGVKPITGWKDSFHTGYNLSGLCRYAEFTSSEAALKPVIDKGLEYYVDNFFCADGSPKYYHNHQYPIDIHCPGQLIQTLYDTGTYTKHRALVHRVMQWTLSNMRAPQGYFYYQLKRGISSRISYMRWSNAFMFASLALMLRCETENNCSHICEY